MQKNCPHKQQKNPLMWLTNQVEYFSLKLLTLQWTQWITKKPHNTQQPMHKTSIVVPAMWLSLKTPFTSLKNVKGNLQTLNNQRCQFNTNTH